MQKLNRIFIVVTIILLINSVLRSEIMEKSKYFEETIIKLIKGIIMTKQFQMDLFLMKKLQLKLQK